MIRLHVKSLSELRARHQPGEFVSGTVCSTSEGTFTLSLYPSGDKLSNPGFIGVYLTCLSLKDPKIKGVRVGATWNLLAEDGTLVTSRHEKLTPILLTPDPGEDPSLGKGRGYTNFCRAGSELETFTATADFVVREVVMEDGSIRPPMAALHPDAAAAMLAHPGAAAGGGGDVEGGDTLEALLSRVRALHVQETARIRKPRVYTVEELLDLTQEELFKLQENMSVALTKKVELELKCSICLERNKDHVCVPCGHRYCGMCIGQVAKCAECRETITQKLKCF